MFSVISLSRHNGSSPAMLFFRPYRRSVLSLILLIAVFACAAAGAARAADRIRFDTGWKFFMGYSDPRPPINWSSNGGAEGPAGWNFADGDWLPVDLPHDWVIALPVDEKKGHAQQGYKQVGWNFPQNNIGWYRKTFDLPSALKGRHVSIVFDGVFSDATVWMNGYLLGLHPSGYTSFRYDITSLLSSERSNVIAVRADAGETSLWSYEGGGIYRHVWLVVSDPVAIEPDTTFVRTSFASGVPDGGPAAIHVDSAVGNHGTTPVSAIITTRCRRCQGQRGRFT